MVCTKLIDASRMGDTARVSSLIDEGMDKNIQNKEGNTALILASRNGHAAIVTLLVAAGADVHVKNKDGWTALTWAIERLDKNIAKILVQAGAEVRRQVKTLLGSFSRLRLDVVKLLLALGADVNARGKDKRTMLMGAVAEDNADTMQLLLAAGANVQLRNKDKRTALMYALERPSDDFAITLLEAGARAGVRDKAGWTTLMLASKLGHICAAKLLIARGASVCLCNIDGYTALMLASKCGHAEVVKLLLDAGAVADVQNQAGDTALMWASVKGHTKAVRVLVAAGAVLDVQDQDGWTALLLASDDGHAEVVQALVAAGADLHVANKVGSTALMRASYHGHAEIVKLLVSAGANANAKDQTGRSALMHASKKGLDRIVRLLLAEAGADKDLQDELGNTALMLACSKGKDAIVKVLVNAQVDLSVQNKDGKTAVMLAAAAGCAAAVTSIVGAGTDVCTHDMSGNTALMVSAESGFADVVKALVGAGAKLDAQDQEGRTALMRAVGKNRAQVVELLLKAGADKTVMDRTGQTVLDDIEQQTHLIKNLLLSECAPPARPATRTPGETPSVLPANVTSPGAVPISPAQTNNATSISDMASSAEVPVPPAAAVDAQEEPSFVTPSPQLIPPVIAVPATSDARPTVSAKTGPVASTAVPEALADVVIARTTGSAQSAADPVALTKAAIPTVGTVEMAVTEPAATTAGLVAASETMTPPTSALAGDINCFTPAPAEISPSNPAACPAPLSTTSPVAPRAAKNFVNAALSTCAVLVADATDVVTLSDTVAPQVAIDSVMLVKASYGEVLVEGLATVAGETSSSTTKVPISKVQISPVPVSTLPAQRSDPQMPTAPTISLTACPEIKSLAALVPFAPTKARRPKAGSSSIWAKDWNSLVFSSPSKESSASSLRRETSSAASKFSPNTTACVVSSPMPSTPVSPVPSPTTPVAFASFTAHSTVLALQQECENLLTQAVAVVRQRELAQRREAVTVRLSAAMAARDIVLIAAIRREEAALERDRTGFVLSEEDLGALLSSLRDVEDRIFAFSLECDVDTLDDVAELQQAVHSKIDALLSSPTEPFAGEPSLTTPPLTSKYCIGTNPIENVHSLFSEDAAGRSTAPSARPMLRGRFSARDELNGVHQYLCVIKCAPEEAPQHGAHSITAMRREHKMYEEVQRLAGQKHSGCVRFYDANTQHHYLVLEEHGVDLRDLLNPSLRAPQLVLEAIVSAVHALHSLGIMHGDIKPQNLLYKWVDHDYVVKLCDLDAAHKVDDVCQAVSLGSKHYHAPELRAAASRGDSIKASLELDMFPLGLVLWQVLGRSPHAALDSSDADALYSSQRKLDAHLNYSSFYETDLRKATRINPAQRVNIADLHRAIKTLSASSAQQGWLHLKEENQQLKQVVGSQYETISETMGSISEKVDRIDAKLDHALQELRTGFSALSTSAVEIAGSLWKEIMLGKQQAQILPDMIRATQDALQRLSEAPSKVPDKSPQSPAITSAELQECLTTMQASIEAAVARALSQQKTAVAWEISALAHQLQVRFTALSSELRLHLQEQHLSNAQSTPQSGALTHISECLKTGLTEVLHGLAEVHGELSELKSNQALLGQKVAHVLRESEELAAMVRTLLKDTHGMPTLAVILPVVSTSWKSRFSPMRLVRDQYRLYFLCSHTNQIAPCGPKGKGYKVTMTKEWVLNAAPVLRVGLVLLKLALLASGLPLPVPDLCSALVDKTMHIQYLNAALHIVSHPPDGVLGNAEYTMQQTLDAIDAHDYSDYKAPGAEIRLQEGSRKAYETIKEILGRDAVNIPLTCGLRDVTHLGKTAWVLDNEDVVLDWKRSLDSSVQLNP